MLTAQAQILEAEAGLSRAQFTHDYWKVQSARFTSLVKDNVLDKQTEEETLNQFRSSAAALAESKRQRSPSAKAVQQEKEHSRAKAEVDILAADADRRRQADLVGYAKLTAPYEGIVTHKNVNLQQFVQPATRGGWGRRALLLSNERTSFASSCRCRRPTPIGCASAPPLIVRASSDLRPESSRAR